MLFPYRSLYRWGITPWERRPMPASFRRAVEAWDGAQPKRALDVGCGTGGDAVHLAQHGWEVTGIDAVPSALSQAAERARRAGVAVRWVEADVGDLGRLGLEPGYTLLYDFGCLHGLAAPALVAAALALGGLAAPGASLFLLAFRRARRLLMPHGLDEDEIVHLLGRAWSLGDRETLRSADMPPAVQRARPTVYRLIRRAGGSEPTRLPN